jgi:hypothetical protein
VNEPNKWKLILASRKFWACVVGLTFIILKTYLPNFPLSEEAVAAAAALLASYILGVALEDGIQRR